MEAPLRILIADPQPIVREGLTALLSCQEDMQVVGQATCAEEAFDLFCTLHPHVLVMEVDQPDKNGIELIQTLRKHCPSACILVLSYHAEEEIIYRAIQAGTRGYYVKDIEAEALVEMVRRVGAGETVFSTAVREKLVSRSQRQELTQREQEVLAQMVAGGSNKEIADRLFIAEGTTKVHVGEILRKLGVSDRTQAVLTAFKRGIVSLVSEC